MAGRCRLPCCIQLYRQAAIEWSCDNNDACRLAPINFIASLATFVDQGGRLSHIELCNSDENKHVFNGLEKIYLGTDGLGAAATGPKVRWALVATYIHNSVFTM